MALGQMVIVPLKVVPLALAPMGLITMTNSQMAVAPITVGHI
jgi:hypothetical protein